MHERTEAALPGSRFAKRHGLEPTALPAELAPLLEYQRTEAGLVHFLSRGTLSELLAKLVAKGTEVIHVQPEGLRAIYERYHDSGDGES
jgi:hypothetical protein